MFQLRRSLLSRSAMLKHSFSPVRSPLSAPASSGPRRVTAETAHRRNEFVATLATEIAVLHATPGGRMGRLLQQLQPQASRVTRLADLAP